MFREYDFRRYDFFLIILVIAIVSFGIIAIKSATLNFVDPDSYYKKQIIGFALGFVMMIVISIMDYRFIAKFYWVFYLINIILLVAVILFGKNVNGATRWISIGGFTLQASEFCKTFLTIFLAKFLDRYKTKLNKPWFLGIILILTMIPTALVYIEPNLSTTLVIIALIGSLVFVGGLNFKYIFVLLIILIPSVVFGLWYIQQPDQKLLKDYQVTRITTMLYPDRASASDKAQSLNSVYAIGSGQLWGKGLYQGKLNKYNYLPEAQTDFIFSIIGEELGFVGCSAALGLLFLIMIRCLVIAKDARDMTAKLIIIGFCSILIFQSFVNVGVVTNILPNTGIPFPFLSSGSSSLWSNMIFLGLILNISMQRKSIYY